MSGFIAVWYFLSHWPCRVVTTSVKDDHLRVLWGEVGRFIDSSRPGLPLKAKEGGPLIVKHRELLRRIGPTRNRDGTYGEVCKISYVRGMVSERGEGLAGHHAPFTLLIVDEASGVDEMVPERCSSWAKKSLYISNPYGSPQSWLAKIVKRGDVLA